MTWGEGKKQFMAMTLLLHPATYNTIFSQPLLNTFRIVVLTYHIVVKFLIHGEEIIIKGNMN